MFWNMKTWAMLDVLEEEVQTVQGSISLQKYVVINSPGFSWSLYITNFHLLQGPQFIFAVYVIGVQVNK